MKPFPVSQATAVFHTQERERERERDDEEDDFPTSLRVFLVSAGAAAAAGLFRKFNETSRDFVTVESFFS